MAIATHSNALDLEHLEEELSPAMRTQSIVALEPTDSTVSPSYANGAELDLVPDGDEREHELRGFGEVKAKAQWKDGILNLERKLDGGANIKDEFTRSPGSTRLVVTTKLKPGGMPRELTFTSVYDLDESDS